MERSNKEAMGHSPDLDSIIRFIRQNDLAREVDTTPVITSKGEEFLNALRGPVEGSNPGNPGAF
jgi:hypothetical protein